jgi:phage-related holin
MLILDFNTLYDAYYYKTCWLCNNELKNVSYEVGLLISCSYCEYSLIFDYIIKDGLQIRDINIFYSLIYNGIVISEKHNKLKIKLPINLDKCLEIIDKLQILL